MHQTTLSQAIALGAMLYVGLVSGQTHSDLRRKDVEKQINVVFNRADDLGWSDTELYGTTKVYKTPNILRLAERGCTLA